MSKHLFFQAGEGHSRHSNQYLLTLLALTKGSQLQPISEALLGAMGYNNPINYQRIALLLELGANPHYLGGFEWPRRNPLTLLAGKNSYLRKENPDHKSPILCLLNALNSKIINDNKEYYIDSIRNYFSEEIRLHKNLIKMAENNLEAEFFESLSKEDKKEKPRAIIGSGGGFLHWAAFSGRGLIPILCADYVARKRIFEQDDSGIFFKLFSEELLINI